MSEEFLTADQKKFLAECETEFANRFTEEDKEFMMVFNNPIPDPPIMKDWDRYSRDWNRRPRRGGYREHRERGHSSYRGERQPYERRQEYKRHQDNFYTNRDSY